MPIDRSGEPGETTPRADELSFDEAKAERDAWRAAAFDKIDLNNRTDGRAWDRTPEPLTSDELGLTGAEAEAHTKNLEALHAERAAGAVERPSRVRIVISEYDLSADPANLGLDLWTRPPAGKADTDPGISDVSSETAAPAQDEQGGGFESPPLERADRPHDAAQPVTVRDYYPNIPPSVDERYLVRDQAKPVPLFDRTPAREQTAQGQVGDCGIVSTLGAVAAHRPEAIQNAITQTGDGRYEVRLHEVTPATPRDPVARPTGDTVTYRMNDELPVRTDKTDRPPVGMKADTCGWPALLEKAVASQDQTWNAKQESDWDRAWAAYNKTSVDAQRRADGLPPSPADAPTGYNRLDIGSTAYQRADLLAEITGKEAEVRVMPNEQQGEQALLAEFRQQLADGKPVLVGTRGRQAGETLPSSRDVFAFGHAYEVTKVEADKIHLRNPWGPDAFGQTSDPPPMDVKTFWEYYRHYDTNRSRIGYYSTLK